MFAGNSVWRSRSGDFVVIIATKSKAEAASALTRLVIMKTNRLFPGPFLPRGDSLHFSKSLVKKLGLLCS